MYNVSHRGEKYPKLGEWVIWDYLVGMYIFNTYNGVDITYTEILSPHHYKLSEIV